MRPYNAAALLPGQLHSWGSDSSQKETEKTKDRRPDLLNVRPVDHAITGVVECPTIPAIHASAAFVPFVIFC
jgi:hypothetical protein